MSVIVDCENCHTRFRLDDDRVPLGGAKVRCSKCKTAFVVKRAAASRDELIEEVVAEATSPGASTAPAPSEDLFEASSAALDFDSKEDSANEVSSDEKWEFDEAPPVDSAARPLDGASKAPVRPEAAASPSEGLESLGSPEEWDLLGNAREVAADARFETSAEGPLASGAPRVQEASHTPQPALRSVDDTLEALAAAVPRREAARPAAWVESARELFRSAIASGIWLASIALCAVGLLLALVPAAETSVAGATTLVASLGNESVETTRHRFETGVGETLTVLRGHLPRTEAIATTRVRVMWVDAQGKPVASAIAGRPLSTRELRESSLVRLRAAYGASALEVARGGAFEVAFGELPAGARGIAIKRERVSLPTAPATQVRVQIEDGAGRGSATTSSRPTARPSSE
jgi:predicted Zn finger-like uncharacterized protein